MKRIVVVALEQACTQLDRVAGLGCRFTPFARWSYELDERWHTGEWHDPSPD